MPVWKQHLITAASAIFAVGVAWAALNAQVENNQALAEDNKEKVKEIDKRLQGIERKQDVLDTKVEGEIDRQDEYREDTKDTLRRILQKLDNNPPPPRDPR